MTATFKAGEIVLFRRDWGDRWRLGAYVSLIEDAHHRVRTHMTNALNVFVRRGRMIADPRGAQVTMQWKGQTLLGDVSDVVLDGGFYKLTVKHFNGEEWPLRPVISSCQVLERTYEPEPS